MDPVEGVLAVSIEVERPSSERVSRAALQAACISRVLSRLSLDHVRGRRPPRPFSLASDNGRAGKAQTRPANTDPVAPGKAALLDEVEELLCRIDDDGSRPIAGEEDALRQISRIKLERVMCSRLTGQRSEGDNAGQKLPSSGHLSSPALADVDAGDWQTNRESLVPPVT